MILSLSNSALPSVKVRALVVFWCGFMNRRIEHVHDIDRAHISDGVVEVLSERRTEGECFPVVGVADEALDFAHIGYFYRHINEILVSVTPDQVHRCGADIRGTTSA